MAIKTKFDVGDMVRVHDKSGELVSATITGIKIYKNESKKQIIYETWDGEFYEREAVLVCTASSTNEEIKQTKQVLKRWYKKR